MEKLDTIFFIVCIYDCWLMFVKICHQLCQREILASQLKKIDEAIEDFCTKFEILYGKESLSPNMHLMAHLSDCIYDHGPVYAFWLYVFERMNGILGSFQTNNRDLTVQLMRKFISMQCASIEKWPEDFKNEISPLFKSYCKESGSLMETLSLNLTSDAKPLPPILEKSFDSSEIAEVTKCLLNLYNNDFRVLRLYRTTLAAGFGESMKLASARSRYANCSKVFIENKLYEINHFVQCTVIETDSATNETTTHRHLLAQCSSYLDHICKPWYGYQFDLRKNSDNHCLKQQTKPVLN